MASKTVVLDRSDARNLLDVCRIYDNVLQDAKEATTYSIKWLEIASIVIPSTLFGALVELYSEYNSRSWVEDARKETLDELIKYVRLMEKNNYRNIEVKMYYEYSYTPSRESIEMPKGFSITGVQNENGSWEYVN